MSVLGTDVTLIRGSVSLTIAGVVYSAVDFKDQAKARMEKDYFTDGSFRGASSIEDAEEITCTIRARSDQATPPKFTNFAYNGKNWYIYDREFSGSQSGIQQYACTIIESPSGTVTATTLTS